MITKSKLLKLTGIYLDRYEKIADEADRSILEAVVNYDLWFNTEYIKQLESMLTIVGGRWSIEDSSPGIISQAAKLAMNKATEIIVDPAVSWVTANYPLFWKQGVEGLWTINLEMQGKPYPRKVQISDAEIDQIIMYMERRTETLQDHVQRHRRQVARAVGNGIQMGWTTDRFLSAMTAPDGHIVGFPYGNSRYSWYEHLRRMVVGRSRMIAQAAVEYRMARATK